MVSLFKHWRTTYERVDKFLSDTYFTDVNLHGKIICDTQNLSAVFHLNDVTQPQLSSKDNPQMHDSTALTFSQVISVSDEYWTVIDSDKYTFGPTWSVHWFKLCLRVPGQWLTRDGMRVELQWQSGCEVLVFSSLGTLITGLNSTHSRVSVPLASITDSINDRDTYSVYLQASCSDLFGAGEGGMIRPPSKDKMVTVHIARLVLVSVAAVTLSRDLRLLLEIAETLKDSERGHRALYAANEAVNVMVDLRDDDVNKKLSRAQTIVDKFFTQRNGETAVTLHAMGHCHIDSAWLWRYGETRRKIARSWATTLRLLETHPHMTFVCSQAQQLSWLKEDYPDLFHQLQIMSSRKQFLPVGGVWIEMDVNLPCCESLCRQFLYGQRFFKENFGAYCNEFWLPDTFGYSAQLPQIMRQANISRFMTQKMSWSLVNKFPHHTFWWRGIDGSRVLAHFPPGDSYSMNGKVSEIFHTVNNFADKGRSSSMMYLYGYGDGGQGPTEEMIHVLDRLQDCDGVPRIVHSSPDKFFGHLEDKDMNNLCTWTGELFLELHNGTYTSQRQIKKGNNRCEQLLRVVEFLTCLALTNSSLHYNGDQINDSVDAIRNQLESKWKILLLNQFHDVLPGSSIEQVCDDAYWAFDCVREWCCSSIRDLAMLVTHSQYFSINPTSWPLLMPVYDDDIKSYTGFSYIPPYTVTTAVLPQMTCPTVQYVYDITTKLHKISNQFLDVCVDEYCRLTTLRLKSSPDLGNVLSAPANELFLYDDVPLYWDAWDIMDYHLETGTPLSSVASFRLKEVLTVTSDDMSVTLTCVFVLEKTGTVIETCVTICSHLDYVELCSKVVSWQETHRILKVRIPTIINSVDIHYRTQAGILSRARHGNTSWDWAKYEVCSHEWILMGETNWGVAVFKDAIYGSSTRAGGGAGGSGSGATIDLSLLRSTTSPDSTADKKHLPHIFNYAIYPFNNGAANNFATVSKKAAQFCWRTVVSELWPLQRYLSQGAQQQPMMDSCSFPLCLVAPVSGEVTIDWIKESCEDRRIFIVRIHEQVGGRYLVRLASQLPIRVAHLTNILEQIDSANELAFHFSVNDIELSIAPFKIVSVAVEFVV